MTQIKIGTTTYPAQIMGRVQDKDWDSRESKAITLTMTYTAAITLFANGLSWSIVDDDNTEYDNSAFSLAGDVTDHRNGTVTVKMGKPTSEELLQASYDEMVLNELGGAE